MAVDGRGVELDVVDADDLPPVDVDDLLVEQIALEEQDTVRGRVFLPGRAVVGGADGGPARLEHRGREHALAVGCPDD